MEGGGLVVLLLGLFLRVGDLLVLLFDIGIFDLKQQLSNKLPIIVLQNCELYFLNYCIETNILLYRVEWTRETHVFLREYQSIGEKEGNSELMK